MRQARKTELERWSIWFISAGEVDGAAGGENWFRRRTGSGGDGRVQLRLSLTLTSVQFSPLAAPSISQPEMNQDVFVELELVVGSMEVWKEHPKDAQGLGDTVVDALEKLRRHGLDEAVVVEEDALRPSQRGGDFTSEGFVAEALVPSARYDTDRGCEYSGERKSTRESTPSSREPRGFSKSSTLSNYHSYHSTLLPVNIKA
nr:hypothetical protein Iba_chr04dCG16270 [Ipomoea batatas]